MKTAESRNKSVAPAWSEVAFEQVRWTAFGPSQGRIMLLLTRHGVTMTFFFAPPYTTQHFLSKEILRKR